MSKPSYPWPLSVGELQVALSPLNLNGEWEEQKNSVWAFRQPNGAILFCSETRKKVYFGGPDNVALPLSQRVMPLLENYLSTESSRMLIVHIADEVSEKKLVGIIQDAGFPYEIFSR